MPLTGSLGTLLLRGLLVGLIAGLLAATVGNFVGEPNVDAAIAIEESHSQPETAGSGHSHSDEDEPLVSRTGQKFGQFLALALAGMALGALFATVAHFVRRYTSTPGPRLALGLGLAGWAAIVAVPFFKYPANPPAVGNPDTIDERTLLWVAGVLLGIAAVGAGVYMYTLLRNWSTFRLIAGVAAFVVVVIVGYVLLPGVNEVPADFPADLLWRFRVSSLAETATLWASLALGFAALTRFATRTGTPVVEQVSTTG